VRTLPLAAGHATGHARESHLSPTPHAGLRTDSPAAEGGNPGSGHVSEDHQ